MWSLPAIGDYSLQVTPEDEAIITGGTQLQDARGTSLKYQFTHYTRGSSFTATANHLAFPQNIKGWKLNNAFMYSNMNATNDKGFFFRPTIDISRQFPALKNYTLDSITLSNTTRCEIN